MRGLGTGSGGESLDQSAGLFIDGIWAGRIREFQSALFDVERIEVMKGTQTSLLGKNTSLGAISVISRRPGDELGGYMQADYEFEFESTYINAAIDLPSDFGNYRVAINLVDEGGYVDNKTTGNEVPEREQNTVRTSGEWLVVDNGNLLLSYQYDDLEIHGDTFQPDNDADGFMAAMDPTADIGIDRTKYAFSSFSSSGDAEDEQDSQRALLRYDHDPGRHQLTALTGWTEYDNDRLTDSDFLSVDYLTTVYESDYEQFSAGTAHRLPRVRVPGLCRGSVLPRQRNGLLYAHRRQFPAAFPNQRPAPGQRQPANVLPGHRGVVIVRSRDYRPG